MSYYSPAPTPPPPGDYGSVQTYPVGRRPSRTLAMWSLALALLICIPFGWVVSIALAIAVLVGPNGGRDSGRRLAWGAIAISLVVATAYGVFLVWGASNGFFDEVQRDDQGRITNEAQVGYEELRVGDCLNDVEGDFDLPLALPCDRPHDLEVFAVYVPEVDDFPGDEEMSRIADRGCRREFQGYVGRGFDRSVLTYQYVYPSSVSWRIRDRDVICMLEDPIGEVTGSLRNSRR